MEIDDSVVGACLGALDAIERTGLPYALMGGFALNAWGVPRATFDIDVEIACDEPDLARLCDALETHGVEVGAEYRRGWVDRFDDGFRMIKGSAWSAGDRAVTVDVFLVSTPFQRSSLDRRIRVDVVGRAAWVISAADLLLFKLLAWRRKDRVDLDNVLTLQGVPEPDYVRNWARKLGIEDRLNEALRDVGLA